VICRLATVAILVSASTSAAVIPEAGLRQLRFSPDGRYVLAQDNSGIAVLTVSPLAVLLRIPAELAGDAQFTPDSHQIVFLKSLAPADHKPSVAGQRILLARSAPRVERWNVLDGTHVDSAEIKGLNCVTHELSPDGSILACDDPEGTLHIIDVASSETLHERKQFVKLIPVYNYNPDGTVDLPNGQLLGDLGEACFDFSPDGRFLKAEACGGTGTVVVYDLHDRKPIRLAWRLRNMMTQHGSVFMTGGTLLISKGSYHAKQRVKTGTLVLFPSGKILSRPTIPLDQLFRATDPGFVIARPLQAIRRINPNAPTSAVELSTGQVIVSRTPAIDVLGRYYVAEPSPGTVGLYERGKGLQATIALYEK
jgi:hypothetical protein